MVGVGKGDHKAALLMHEPVHRHAARLNKPATLTKGPTGTQVKATGHIITLNACCASSLDMVSMHPHPELGGRHQCDQLVEEVRRVLKQVRQRIAHGNLKRLGRMRRHPIPHLQPHNLAE